MTPSFDKFIAEFREKREKCTVGEWNLVDEIIRTVPDNSNGNRIDPICEGIYRLKAFEVHHSNDFIFICHAANNITKLLEAAQIMKGALELPEMDCGDNSCRYAARTKPMGMRTNGGCRCFEKTEYRLLIQQHLWKSKEALSKIEELLK